MTDFTIKKCLAREVLDSRGNPTVEVELHTSTASASAIVPSGASTGKLEALELRDKDSRYKGKGVLKAVANVNEIAKQVVGMDVREQRRIDQLMIKLDGTPNKSRLGANAILGVSMAAARLAAGLSKKPLYIYISELAGTKPRMPVPFSNVINGGQHAGNNLKIQEFMVVPSTDEFPEMVRRVAEIYQTLKTILLEEFGKSAINVGDEGGFAPPINSGEEAVKLLKRAIELSGYGDRAGVAIDAAASSFFSAGHYMLEQTLTTKQLVDYWARMVSVYQIVSLEDPFAEEDFEGFRLVTARLGKKIPIIGDDILVSSVERIKLAMNEGLCNGLLLKLNQVGSLTEAIEAAKLAMANKWLVMVSHRSGETEDAFIADLAVGLGCGYIKLGAPCRGERTAKYNRLLRISEELKN